jgi:hypothetical protein
VLWHRLGKHGRKRSDAAFGQSRDSLWVAAAGIEGGRVFRPVDRRGYLAGDRIANPHSLD